MKKIIEEICEWITDNCPHKDGDVSQCCYNCKYAPQSKAEDESGKKCPKFCNNDCGAAVD